MFGNWKVKIATAFNVSFLATSKRHSYSITLAPLENGLVINFSKFDTVTMDKQAGTLTVGGGIWTQDVFDTVYKAEYDIRKFIYHPRLNSLKLLPKAYGLEVAYTNVTSFNTKA